jgi:hypothetical protein
MTQLTNFLRRLIPDQLKQPKHDLHVTLKLSHELSGDLNVNNSLEHGVVALAATPP